jgi:hypothetical protein
MENKKESRKGDTSTEKKEESKVNNQNKRTKETIK